MPGPANWLHGSRLPSLQLLGEAMHKTVRPDFSIPDKSCRRPEAPNAFTSHISTCICSSVVLYCANCQNGGTIQTLAQIGPNTWRDNGPHSSDGCWGGFETQGRIGAMTVANSPCHTLFSYMKGARATATATAHLESCRPFNLLHSYDNLTQTKGGSP
jgi:hypothetical protein